MQEHDLGLLSTLVLSLVAAFAGGLAARSLRLPPLVGYLLAGLCIGPFTPGFVANPGIASELAEVGVALLLFNIGMHFSFKDILSVRKIAVPGALFQVALTTFGGALVSHWVLGTDLGASVVIGLSLASASTAIATRILEEKRQLRALAGRLALGWMVVQDVIVILALVLLPALHRAEAQSAEALLTALGKTLFQVAGFVVVMVFGGRRLIPALLNYVARSGSRELFTLAVVVMALGIAYGSAQIFGVSLALGAFFAGVVIGESDMNHHAAAESLSMQQIFTILFFVSIGMLFDPASVLRMPVPIAALLLTVLLGTGFLSFSLMVFLRVPLQAAALVGAAFAQIGEFSFVLSALAYTSGLFGANERDIVIAVAILSIVINPAVVALALYAARWASDKGFGPQKIEDGDETNDSPLEPVLLIGHGRVGSIVAQALRKQSLSLTVIETNRSITEKLRREGQPVLYGDATRESVLLAAKLQQARLMILTIADSFNAQQIIRLAKRLNPGIAIIARTRSDEESRLMTRLGATHTVVGGREIAFGLSTYALQSMGVETDLTRETIAALRRECDEASLSPS